MEIQSWKFFVFWALISIGFLHLGLDKLDRAGLPHSISPLLMCFFKHALAISTCHSSSYALVFRPRIKLPIERRYVWFVLGTFVHSLVIWDPKILFHIWLFGYFFFKDRYLLLLPASFTWYLYEPYHFYLPLCTLINYVLLALVDNPLHEKLSLAFHMAVEASQFLVHGQGLFCPMLVISVSFITSACHAAISGIEPYTEVSWDDPSSGDETFKMTILPLAVKANKVVSIIKENRTWKMVRFASAMTGTVLFQTFFKLTSFDEVVACLQLAVVCLANLTLLRVQDDLGFFHLVLGNVIVGCTVSEFGFGGITWIAYGTTLLLFGLRLKLQSLTFETMEDGEDRREVVVL